MKRHSVLLLLFLIVLPRYAFSEWYKDYESAIELLKKQRYQEAVGKLQSAIAQKSEEEVNTKFYGMKFGDYFPHYYLGLTYFALGQYEAALRELDASESYGSIRRKRDLYERLEQTRKLARAQLTIESPPPTVATEDSASQETKMAQSAPPAADEPAPQPIQEQPVSKPAVSENSTAPPVSSQPPPPAVAQPTEEEIARENAKKVFRSAVRYYLDGEYDRSIRLLLSLNNRTDDRIQLLLGCAYAAKYLLSGAEDQDLYAKAVNLFKKIKAAKPGFQIDNPYISPAVIAIYNKA